ncbi:energy-coupling factor transporter transmembrane protein EcfT [Gordonia sp. TBRC 11910]|uniref:Energy-coupling factor transporter transmembrane protein EcfT n=1 Tax=Gordonia asplenii TaxID=2725283 RepID=A0A848L0E6_9ACTN|nr:energy-coupling factor transporter transmembrane protein EcfT [Gordonia asplenii]NMO04384.1 energy-coupling factor transporter transmembrane protein EcfT [Gordonia asplenii]
MTMRTVPLRQVPGDSVIHRLWAGTKLVIVLILGIMTWVLPSWPALGFVAGVVVVTAVVAGIPLGAIPRPPWWMLGLVAAGVVISASVSGVAGGVVFLRAAMLAVVVVATSILVIWTTPMADIAPALASLMRPLRWLRLPVDEWAVAIALCLRGLPMLIDELRILRAAYRMRPRSKAGGGHPSAQLTLLDMVTAAMSNALRRSAEMAEAITVRGGTGSLVAHPSRPHRRDAVALSVVVAAGAAVIVASFI